MVVLSKRKRIATQIKPHIEELLRLVGLLQADPLTEQELLDLIAAYGVTITRGTFTLDRLQQILNALETVGRQIEVCFAPSASTTAMSTPSNSPPGASAFNEVFPDIAINYDSESSASLTQYNPGDANSGPSITLTLGVGAFQQCVLYRISDREAVSPSSLGLNTPTPLPPCGQEVEINTIKYRWEPVNFLPRTTEAIIRHELGHGLLNLLIDLYSGNVPFVAVYTGLVGIASAPESITIAEILSGVTVEIPNPGAIRRFYFPNVTEFLREYSDNQLWTEDFADTFSFMGRFQMGDEAFAVPDHRNILEQTSRYKAFDENFCCWIGELTGRETNCSD
jgi:hypothetical protein